MRRRHRQGCVLSSRERDKGLVVVALRKVFFILLLLEVRRCIETVTDINALFPLIFIVVQIKEQLGLPGG